MLSFFRVNALYHIFTLFLFSVLLRLPVYLNGLPELIPELQWMLVGERINRGFLMYAEIWDNTAPLSAMVYAGIDLLFGRSQVAYQIFGLFLTTFQAVYFNIMLNNRDVFIKRSFLPGLFYVLFLNISFDCCTLSPVLMSTTFLLFAFSSLTKQLKRLETSDEVFEIGFFIALATLFYPPACVFLLWVIMALMFFSGSSFRQYSLTMFGFILPILFVSLFFYLKDSSDTYFQNFITSVFQIRQYNLNDFKTLFSTLLLPLVFGIMGFLRLTNAMGFNNYQIRSQQVMILWVLFAVVSIGLMPFLAPMQFIVFMPCLAFFTVSFFELYTKKWLAELIFLALMFAILLVNYQAILFPNSESFAKLNNLKLKQKSAYDFKKRKILVLGEGLEEYQNNYSATPYINWNLSKHELEGMDNYLHVINVYKNFDKDPPEVIIDKEKLAIKLFDRIPSIGSKYKKILPNVYERKY
ncbi:MAG: hypothetical protein KA313_00740 [Pseudarcicella sp.]|nr:hypothetical protein [Pseudarcicella sp.]